MIRRIGGKRVTRSGSNSSRRESCPPRAGRRNETQRHREHREKRSNEEGRTENRERILIAHSLFPVLRSSLLPLPHSRWEPAIPHSPSRVAGLTLEPPTYRHRS